jgi:hypothetical protein
MIDTAKDVPLHKFIELPRLFSSAHCVDFHVPHQRSHYKPLINEAWHSTKDSQRRFSKWNMMSVFLDANLLKSHAYQEFVLICLHQQVFSHSRFCVVLTN